MSYTFTIDTPQTLHIIDEQEEKSYYRANQYWYKEGWIRTSGCGPTTYANLIHYLSQTSPKYRSLVESDTANKVGFIDLMNDVWDIVTPGPLGIYTIKKFSEHAIKYGQEKGILLHSKMMEIPICPLLRPTKYELSEFLINTLNNNLPVAFLNRTNGKLSNLSSWHWVTIIGFSPKDMKTEILDNGNNLYIDIELWLETTILGIECFFKACKSFMKLGTEFQSRSFDAMVSHTTIVFTRYMILEWIRRNHNEKKTYGELFYMFCEDIQDMDFTNAITSLMALFVEHATNLSAEITNIIKCKVDDWMRSQAVFVQALFGNLCCLI